MSRSPVSLLKGSAPLFAALGDETRLLLVARLCGDGPMSITKLTAGSKISRQAISKHLRVMEEARLVRCRRRGRESLWALKMGRVENARDYLDQISRQWDDTLGRLQAFVED